MEGVFIPGAKITPSGDVLVPIRNGQGFLTDMFIPNLAYKPMPAVVVVFQKGHQTPANFSGMVRADFKSHMEDDIGVEIVRHELCVFEHKDIEPVHMFSHRTHVVKTTLIFPLRKTG